MHKKLSGKVLTHQLTMDIAVQVKGIKEQQGEYEEGQQKAYADQQQTHEIQQKQYASKTIEQAIAARDWALFKALVEAKADLQCINCIPYLEELQAQGLAIEDLQQQGALCDLPQLQTVTEYYLKRIETHPEEIKYLKRLYIGWQKLIAGLQQNTLKNAEVIQQINANAFKKLIDVWHTGQLPIILQKRIQAHLYTSSIEKHQQWLQNKLPETEQHQLDQKISRVLWEQWKTQIHTDFPAQEQLAINVQYVFKQRYYQQELSEGLTTAIDRKIIGEVIERIKTNSILSAFGEVFQPVVQQLTQEQLKQGKIVTNMLPVYETATQHLIAQWRQGELAEAAAATIDELATKVIAEIRPEPELREQLDEAAVHLLLAQLKQKQLPGEVQAPLLKQTEDTIKYLKPTEGQLNEVLDQLLTEYKSNPAEFSEEERAFLEEAIIGEWKELMEQLKMYVYPVTLVDEVKQLRVENQQVKRQLETQQQIQESKIAQIQKQMELLMQQLQEVQQTEESTTTMRFFSK